MADTAYKEAENRKFTYADYKSWELKKGERFELIYGEAYAMAAPNTVHQRLATQLTGEFYVFFKGKACEVFTAPFDVRLFYEAGESDDTVVQPDLLVVCDPEKLGPEGCRGAPDLALEILSPSNTAIEMNLKLNLYQEARIREYWTVDPENRRVSAYRLQGGLYIVQSYRAGDTAEAAIFPGLKIELPALFGY
ncbi:MAG: Uma2 family endonuclease [Treponema sp.]|jgi:Uma2 family endonuclease|nr:Uma2 family endonuclease [Treponema sp.]